MLKSHGTIAIEVILISKIIVSLFHRSSYKTHSMANHNSVSTKTLVTKFLNHPKKSRTVCIFQYSRQTLKIIRKTLRKIV